MDAELDTLYLSAIYILSSDQMSNTKDAERLIQKISSNSAAVKACVLCKKYKSAFLYAVRDERVDLVKMLRAELLAADPKLVGNTLELCDKFLAKHPDPLDDSSIHVHSGREGTSSAYASSSSNSHSGSGKRSPYSSR